MSWELFGSSAALVCGMITLLWVISVARKDVSVVDPWWLITFLLVAASGVVRTDLEAGKLLILVAVTLWAVRLWAYLRGRRLGRTRGSEVIDHGLWAWSRHPNYFGEALVSWAFWLFALDQPFDWAIVFTPLAMTYLLLRVSGTRMLDARMSATRPEYAKYIERTPSFVPRRPRPYPTS
jgi:steroid 5-alpha reductase family enzyme